MRKITKHEEGLIYLVQSLIYKWLEIKDIDDSTIRMSISDEIKNWDLDESSKRYFESILWNLFKAIRYYGKQKILEEHRGSAKFPDTQTDKYDVYNQI